MSLRRVSEGVNKFAFLFLLMFSLDAGRILLRDEKDAVSFTYLRDTDGSEEDSEAVVRGISRKEGGVQFRQGGKRIYGVYGAIDVEGADYVVYIREAKVVGEVRGSKVYEAIRAGAISISGEESSRMNSVVDSFFRIPGLIFSDNSLAAIGVDRINEDFVFNINPLKKVREKYPGIRGFTKEFIRGFFGMITMDVRGAPVGYYLVSRRSWKNAGTRYHTRGADREGNAANFVESVYLLCREGESDKEYLQVRGSVPVVWEQRINLSYKPPVTIGDKNESRARVRRHFEMLRNRYGKEVAVVNLLDEEGHEEELNFLFRTELEAAEIESLNADYHKVIKGGREKAGEMHSRLCSLIFGNYLMRTNCVDCIDRTNVVQFQIAKLKMYEDICAEQGRSFDELVGELDAKKLSHLWNSNANKLSVQYTGTSALKNDLAEHGMRTLGGMLKDVISSGRRYVHNNFTDGEMQEIIEIFTGVRSSLGNSNRGMAPLWTFLLAGLALFFGGNRNGLFWFVFVPITFFVFGKVFLSYPSPNK
jgi:phosphatidylinositol 4-phosphatase